MSITTITELQNRLNSSTKELTFIQLLKTNSIKNVDLSNNIKTYIDNSYNKTYDYLEIVSNTIYFSYNNTFSLSRPLLFVYITNYMNDISNTDTYLPLNTDHTTTDISNYIQSKISSKGYTTINLLTNYTKYTTYELVFIQLTNTLISKNVDISNNIKTFIDNSYNKTYEYLDITNTQIYNNCNPSAQLNFPILLTYIHNYDTTLKYDEYLNANNTTNIGAVIQRKLTIPSSLSLLKSYIKFTTYDLTFIQLSYSTISPNTDISNTIASYTKNTYNKYYEYLSIVNEPIYKTYNNFGTTPIVVLFFRQYYSSILDSSKYITIDASTNETSVKNLIQKCLPVPTNTITKDKLNLYIYYSTYELTFTKITSPSITNIDISNINAFILNKNMQYLDICNNTIYTDISTNTLIPANTGRPALLLFIKDYIPVSNTYNNPTYLTTTSNTITFISNFLHTRLKNSIYDNNTLKLYATYTNKELNFIQLSRSSINKNQDISNNINAYNKTYDYIDVSNTALYNLYNNRPLSSSEPLLLFFINEYYNGITLYNYKQFVIHYIRTITNYSIFFRNIIQSYLINSINSIETLNKYLYYRPYTSVYLQITTNINIPYTNISGIIDTYEKQYGSTDYIYIDISNTTIYNSYNTVSGIKPNILVLYINSKYYYIVLTENTPSFNIKVLNKKFIYDSILTIRDLERNILPDDDITFVQVIKNNIQKNNDTLNIINTININNKNYNYIDISSSEIYNSYNLTGTQTPILLINIKGLYNIITNLNASSFLNITSTTTINSIYDFIQGKLSTNINSMNDLKTYLKFTTYQITFIRLYKIKPIISKYYIEQIITGYNINNIKVEYIELTSLELIKFYKTYIKTLPSILLFKNIYYNDDRFWEPCKFLSNENTIFSNINNSVNNSYIIKSLGQVQQFLISGLK